MDRLLRTRLLAFRRSASEGTFVLIQRKRSMLAKQSRSNATIELSRAVEHRSQHARDASNEARPRSTSDAYPSDIVVHRSRAKTATSRQALVFQASPRIARLRAFACRHSIEAASSDCARCRAHREPVLASRIDTRCARFAIEFFLGRAVAFFSALRPNLHHLASRAVANRRNLSSRIGCFRRRSLRFNASLTA